MKTILTITGVFAALLASMVAASPDPSQAQTASFEYAFATQQGSDIYIHLINGAEPPGYTARHAFSVPDYHRLAEASASPDGRQIAFGFFAGGMGIKKIYVLDVQTGTTAEIGPFTPWFDDIGELVEPFAPYVWSPDSTRLAFIGGEQDQHGLSTIYLYSTAGQTVTTLTGDGGTHSRIAWSPDGHYLASLGGSADCTDAACDVTLDIWDTVDLALTTRVDLRPYLQLPIPPRTAACYFEWSPDNAYLSFMMGCDVLSRFFFDMYVLDVSHETITRLTQFAQARTLWDNQVQFSATFSTVWHDARTLLIGAAARVTFPDPGVDAIRTGQTAAYAAPDWDETVLTSTVAVEWALNPVSGQLAYRAAEYLPDNPYAPQSVHVQIATLNGGELIPHHQAPTGCGLDWSPDGTALAYGNYTFPGSHCLGLEGFTLVDAGTGTITTVPRPQDVTAHPVGWIRVSD
ncbi:MAG: hypothetical protein JXQ72_06085 [Anaerolineae bacterium]|nr:hypothetical protein [Anaerolineae bacterium]